MNETIFFFKFESLKGCHLLCHKSVYANSFNVRQQASYDEQAGHLIMDLLYCRILDRRSYFVLVSVLLIVSLCTQRHVTVVRVISILGIGCMKSIC